MRCQPQVFDSTHVRKIFSEKYLPQLKTEIINPGNHPSAKNQIWISKYPYPNSLRWNNSKFVCWQWKKNLESSFDGQLLQKIMQNYKNQEVMNLTQWVELENTTVKRIPFPWFRSHATYLKTVTENEYPLRWYLYYRVVIWKSSIQTAIYFYVYNSNQLPRKRYNNQFLSNASFQRNPHGLWLSK